MKERVILHCDLNNFYASVECLLNPGIAETAVAVAGSVKNRHGVVLAKNNIAKKCGVKTGDTSYEALQKCPSLTFIPPHFELYSHFSTQVFNIYTQYTCYVEPFGPDECWLDVTGSVGLFGSGEEIANKIREQVKKDTGLTVSVGVSFNKIFAKLGSDLKKPDATTVISRENFKQKIWNLPANDMLMVGNASIERLHKLNIHTIGELALADDKLLSDHFGINGIKLKKNANGENQEEVRQYDQHRQIESVGHGMTALRDICSPEDLQTMFVFLCDKVATRMRSYKVKGYGVHINLRSYQLKSVSKQTTVTLPTQTGADISKIAMKLAMQIWDGRLPLRTVTVSVFDLVKNDAGVQTSFFDEVDTKKERIEIAIDKIRQKYGHNKIMTANILGNDFIFDKNETEDFLPFKR